MDRIFQAIPIKEKRGCGHLLDMKASDKILLNCVGMSHYLKAHLELGIYLTKVQQLILMPILKSLRSFLNTSGSSA